jgi:hypothetical protein
VAGAAPRALPTALALVTMTVLTGLTALTGCGGSSGGGATAPTSGPTTSTAAASATPTATKVSQAVSTVKGRVHDAGTIVSFKTAGGLTVLVLDRWSVKGLSDAKLASQGVPIAPHTDTRFYDQNKGKTYTIPVNPSAPIVVNTCVKNPGGPPTMTSTPVALTDWLAGASRAKTIVLLTYDTSGRLTRLDTDPAC